MRNKIFGILAALAIALGITVSIAPAASAGTYEILTVYKDAGYQNVSGTYRLNSGTCDGTGYNFTFSSIVGSTGRQMSSANFFSNGPTSGCNYMSVTGFGIGPWGKCINGGDVGISYFGSGFNDNISTVTVKHVSFCPAWH